MTEIICLVWCSSTILQPPLLRGCPIRCPDFIYLEQDLHRDSLTSHPLSRRVTATGPHASLLTASAAVLRSHALKLPCAGRRGRRVHPYTSRPAFDCTQSLPEHLVARSPQGAVGQMANLLDRP
jgi:hypothetical protein